MVPPYAEAYPQIPQLRASDLKIESVIWIEEGGKKLFMADNIDKQEFQVAIASTCSIWVLPIILYLLQNNRSYRRIVRTNEHIKGCSQMMKPCWTLQFICLFI